MDFDTSDDEVYCRAEERQPSTLWEVSADEDVGQLLEGAEFFAPKPWHRRFSSLLFASVAVIVIGVEISGVNKSELVLRKKIPVPMLPNDVLTEAVEADASSVNAQDESLAGR